MWKTEDGSTARLLQLCLGYFVFYAITGVTVKYFLGPPASGFPGMKDMVYLVYSTFGGTLICLVVAIARGWYRLHSNEKRKLGPFEVPVEFYYIIPSGLCTAVVVPTTTLMYTLPISVMVAMVIMRGSVIVISRAVDAIQIKQGILKKKVYPEENFSVVAAIAAVSVHLFWDVLFPSATGKSGNFTFLTNVAAMSILGSYIIAYSFRIYIMNYFKNTRAPGVKLDNNGFFGVEQISASITMVLGAGVIFALPSSIQLAQLDDFRSAFVNPHPMWGWAILSGTAYGVVAFFSVFIFMFRGRTATFAGLVNRLTSLVAGTASTLLVYLLFRSIGKLPKPQDWVSLGFILLAVGFLTVAERKRAAEVVASKAA